MQQDARVLHALRESAAFSRYMGRIALNEMDTLDPLGPAYAMVLDEWGVAPLAQFISQSEVKREDLPTAVDMSDPQRYYTCFDYSSCLPHPKLMLT